MLIQSCYLFLSAIKLQWWSSCRSCQLHLFWQLDVFGLLTVLCFFVLYYTLYPMLYVKIKLWFSTLSTNNHLSLIYHYGFFKVIYQTCSLSLDVSYMEGHQDWWWSCCTLFLLANNKIGKKLSGLMLVSTSYIIGAYWLILSYLIAINTICLTYTDCKESVWSSLITLALHTMY